MPSFTTIFRAAVMLAVGAIIFRGWQMYGPAFEQVKSTAVRGVDMAQAAWQNFRMGDAAPQPTAEPSSAAPLFAGAPQSPAGNIAIAAPALSSQTLTPSPPIGSIPSTSGPTTPALITPSAETGPASGTKDDRVKTLMARLEQLGGTDPKVVPWGTS